MCLHLFIFFHVWLAKFSNSFLECLSGCLDMVAVEGQFTFTAERPQLSCAAFFMAEPNEVISVDYDSVDIDCMGGDFITVS